MSRQTRRSHQRAVRWMQQELRRHRNRFVKRNGQIDLTKLSEYCFNEFWYNQLDLEAAEREVGCADDLFASALDATDVDLDADDD